MVRGRAFFLLLQVLPIAAATALPDPARAASPAPTLSPWLKIIPGDARIGRLASKEAAQLSPNAPGLLLKLDPSAWRAGNAAAREAVRALTVDAHRAGWRWGLDLELPDVTIPADVRAAESATVEDLWPGLGEILRAAVETDLVTIEFPSSSTPGFLAIGRPQGGTFDPKARSYLFRKAAAGARAAAPHARLVLAAGPLARGQLLPADVRIVLSEENTAYVDFLGATPLAPPSPERSESRSTTSRSESPGSSTSISPTSALPAHSSPSPRGSRRRTSPSPPRRPHGRRPRTPPSSASRASWTETSGPIPARRRPLPRAAKRSTCSDSSRERILAASS